MGITRANKQLQWELQAKDMMLASLSTQLNHAAKPYLQCAQGYQEQKGQALVMDPLWQTGPPMKTKITLNIPMIRNTALLEEEPEEAKLFLELLKVA